MKTEAEFGTAIGVITNLHGNPFPSPETFLYRYRVKYK